MVRARSNSVGSVPTRSEGGDSDFEQEPPTALALQCGTQSSAKETDQLSNAVGGTSPSIDMRTAMRDTQEAASPSRVPTPNSAVISKRSSRRGLGVEQDTLTAARDVDNALPATTAARVTRGRASARLAKNRSETCREKSESELEEEELDEVDETDVVDEVDAADAAFSCSSEEEAESQSEELSSESDADETPKAKRRGRGRQPVGARRSAASRATSASRSDSATTKPLSRVTSAGRRLGTKNAAAPLMMKKTSDSQTSQPVVIQSRVAGGFRVGLSRSALLVKRK
ncbi:hypothetical protein CCYA_CCYA02G0634 [Cyanidiococcus yangmingshanensis]|nr:hypothetical protein CCYA_CCYA02G0634 [Cyanidiococcus yangmingshanensis]